MNYPTVQAGALKESSRNGEAITVSMGRGRFHPVLQATSAWNKARKAELRRQLTNLPYEEKLRRIVKLQKRAYVLANSAGRKKARPWGSEKLGGHVAET
jgi:hypothetical protein